MFQIGDCIAYGVSGICRVSDICASPFDSKDTRRFYVLKSLTETDRTIYSPADTCNEVGRTPYTTENLTALFANLSVVDEIEVPQEKRRKDFYRAAMANPIPEVCLQMLKTVAARRAACLVQRKRLPAMDAEYEGLAKKLLLQEIIYAFQETLASAEEKLQMVLSGLKSQVTA